MWIVPIISEEKFLEPLTLVIFTIFLWILRPSCSACLRRQPSYGHVIKWKTAHIKWHDMSIKLLITLFSLLYSFSSAVVKWSVVPPEVVEATKKHPLCLASKACLPLVSRSCFWIWHIGGKSQTDSLQSAGHAHQHGELGPMQGLPHGSKYVLAEVTGILEKINCKAEIWN